MTNELGLRERKKQRTRQLIHEAAFRLFAEHGFDAVTVADVARAAEVSEMTVFNYFRTKEELFFDGMEFFEEKLLAAVRERPPDVSALSAFRGVVLDGFASLAEEGHADAIAQAARVINGSPALQAREREITAAYTRRLATYLADETGVDAGDVEPWAVARALMGIHQATVDHVRASILARLRGPQLVATTRAQAERGFERLAGGLADYAVR